MRRLTLLLLSIRHLLATAGPVLLLAVGLLAAAHSWLHPQPPKTVRLATGPDGSAYAGFGQRYAQALAREGITVQLIATEGSVANLKLLQDGDADVAFVRGGSGAAPVTANASAAAASDAAPAADPNESLQSLGALFYEPLWIFMRQDATAAPGMLAQLKGLRVSVDQAGSGMPALMQRLLAASGLAAGEVQLSEQDARSAAQALQAGQLDAVVLTSAPQSPVVQALLRMPGIAPLELAQADAYTRRFPFFRTVTLPRGVADLAADVPPHDVTLLAATTSLLTREQTHPALRQLFAQAAQVIHSRAGWLSGAREFPNTRTSELPVSPEGDRAINGTPPVWQRWLPFWASNLVQRMWLVLGGLLVLLLPLSRVVPPLYTFRVRRRVFRWYARLRQIETRAQDPRVARTALLDELDELDRVANQIAVPLAHADELYALRDNIDTVRQRVLMQRTEDAQ